MTDFLNALCEDGRLPEPCASPVFWRDLAAAVAAKGRKDTRRRQRLALKARRAKAGAKT